MFAFLKRHPCWIALIAGLASATGFEPLNLWPVTLICLTVWLWLTNDAATLKSAMLRGWVFGVGLFTVGDNWIQHAFDFQEKMPPWLGYIAVVLLALYLAVYPAIAGGLIWRFGREGPVPGTRFALVAGAAWILTEWLRGTLFTGYPWNPMAVIWLPVGGVAHLASWIGTYALSGVTIVVAAAILAAVYRQWRLPAVVMVLLIVRGIIIPHAPPPAANAPHVHVVQPNIGQQAVHEDDYAGRVLRKLLALSGRPGPVPRLVVWPEGMVNYYIEDGYPVEWYGGIDPRSVRAAIASILGPHDMALVGGTALFFNQQQQITGAGNSVFIVDPAAKLQGRYDKAHLVPYGEYLPMRWLLGRLGVARLVMGDIDFIPGPGPRSYAVSGFGNIGMQICYEIIFSGHVVDEAHRPDMIFNPSNDAWFGKWGPPEHLAQARMRAIEEGLPILRSTPTGISAVIDADGKLVAHIPQGVAGAIDVPIPAKKPPTLFSRVGNRMALIVGVLFLIGAVAFRRRSR
ncbi:apolipoprotein N-acyltransferase [Stakelama sediminis]|uniref:Apolipoprotein N-acyltransferase n=1 Tax=Stakelama sediminis TaxID=463200 RepID=A0A840YXE3_9SPHN|nr:apolipoprotein N-acyltransferase [Stakelama sediminis]MBB5718206.1 apolipoprotein N-acyltransferase [Stakelama sediminis]